MQGISRVTNKTPSNMPLTLTELYNQYKEKETKAYESNLARKKEIENIFEKQIGMYAPGGAFEKASKAELETQKVRDVGAVSQSDISRGLYGIRPYEQEWESSVGAKARLTLEDLMQQRQAQVLSAKASFLEGVQEPYPDYSALTQAMAASASNTSTGLPATNEKGVRKITRGIRARGSLGGNSGLGISYSPGTPSAGFLS